MPRFINALALLVATGLIATHAHGQEVSTVTSVIDGGTGGLAVDAQGNVFMGDFGPNLSGHGTRVFKVTPEGDVSVFASGFDGASGNDFDSHGNLFQSNINAGRIDKIAPDGTVTPFASGLSAPVGITIDDGDTLYVCNCGSGSIQKIAPDGTSSVFATSPVFQCPNGITRDDTGNLYVSNFNNGSLIKITPTGSLSILAVVPGGNNGHVVYYDGLLYVASRGGNRIFTVTLEGAVSLLAGSGLAGNDDGPLSEATFSLPNDVVPDPTGRYLYVNDVVDAKNPSDTAPMLLRRIDLGSPASAPSLDESMRVNGVRVVSVHPNPFATTATISLSVDRTMPVRVTIHDVQGREVARVVDGVLGPGRHDATWRDGGSAGVLPQGTFYYRVSSPEGTFGGTVQRIR
ncbi:MAG: hypothetical protein KC729_04890 [Candidatus Eisenbacteria bacterium]|uniref:T9SS type A sorting domain-containing protein n=1 Tax=Eiseniibacteriota bacterium TaxID=2212470 RepID=A0A956LXB5_UNCEI|nr:hypothetical protein [Candidatus Eisenbacteria bacterium]